MRLIPASNSDTSYLVDDEDYDYLMQWKWKSNNHGYACRNTRQGALLMHILIAQRHGLSTEREIDHIDQVPQNNQFSNLRSATHQQNLMNRPANTNNTSGYKGVTYLPLTGKWLAQLSVERRHISLGSYLCVKRAARAYNAAAKRLFGEFAYLNPHVECGLECLICHKLETVNAC